MSRRRGADAGEEASASRKSRRLHRFPTEERLAVAFTQLPDVVRYNVCRFLDVRSVLRLSMTSKEMAQKMPWKLLAIDLFSSLRGSLKDLSKIDNERYSQRLTRGITWDVPASIHKRLVEGATRMCELADHESLPISIDAAQIYRLLATSCCISCSSPCNIASCFWFGHRLCSNCFRNTRTPHYKLIPRSDAQLKYKSLDTSQFCVALLRGKSASGKPIYTLWERQLVLASRTFQKEQKITKKR